MVTLYHLAPYWDPSVGGHEKVGRWAQLVPHSPQGHPSDQKSSLLLGKHVLVLVVGSFGEMVVLLFVLSEFKLSCHEGQVCVFPLIHFLTQQEHIVL